MNHDCEKSGMWSDGDRFSIGPATGVIIVINKANVSVKFDDNNSAVGQFTNMVSREWFESVATYVKPRTAYDDFLDLKPGQLFLLDDAYPDNIKRVKLSDTEYIRLGSDIIIKVHPNDGNVMHLGGVKLIISEP